MGLAPLDFPILLGPRPSWPILICLRAHRTHRSGLGKPACLPLPGLAEAQSSPVRTLFVLSACAGGYGVLLLLASLGLALPHLEGGCWADASLRRGSDRSWTALSQHGPQSFLPVAWPTSVLPKRSEWVWQIYYLSHLYLLSRPVRRPVALFFVCSWWFHSWIHGPASTSCLLPSPVSSRPVPSCAVQSALVRPSHVTQVRDRHLRALAYFTRALLPPQEGGELCHLRPVPSRSGQSRAEQAEHSAPHLTTHQ